MELWIVGIVLTLLILRQMWKAHTHPSQILCRQAAHMNWVYAGTEMDADGYKNNKLQRGEYEAIVSFVNENVQLLSPNHPTTFKDFVELESWLAQNKNVCDFEESDDEENDEEFNFYQAVEGLVTEFGYYEQLLEAQGTDKEFYIASMKLCNAGFNAGKSDRFIAAFMIEAVKRYEINEHHAIIYLKALEKQMEKEPSDDDDGVPDRANIKPKEYSNYHEALDEIVDLIREPMTAICTDEEPASVEIKCELLGYAAAYQAKLLIGAEMHPTIWNSFKSSVENRIFSLLEKKPELSGSNILPNGGVELISYSSVYTTYMGELQKIIDQNANPGVVDLPPLLSYFSIDHDATQPENIENLGQKLNRSVGLCSRAVVPEVQSVFS